MEATYFIPFKGMTISKNGNNLIHALNESSAKYENNLKHTFKKAVQTKDESRLKHSYKKRLRTF